MTMPEWRRRQLAKAKPVGDWWRRRHHCSDGVVLGSNHQLTDVEQKVHTQQQQPQVSADDKETNS